MHVNAHRSLQILSRLWVAIHCNVATRTSEAKMCFIEHSSGVCFILRTWECSHTIEDMFYTHRGYVLHAAVHQIPAQLTAVSGSVRVTLVQVQCVLHLYRFNACYTCTGSVRVTLVQVQCVLHLYSLRMKQTVTLQLDK